MKTPKVGKTLDLIIGVAECPEKLVAARCSAIEHENDGTRLRGTAIGRGTTRPVSARISMNRGLVVQDRRHDRTSLEYDCNAAVMRALPRRLAGSAKAAPRQDGSIQFVAFSSAGSRSPDRIAAGNDPVEDVGDGKVHRLLLWGRAGAAMGGRGVRNNPDNFTLAHDLQVPHRQQKGLTNGKGRKARRGIMHFGWHLRRSFPVRQVLLVFDDHP
jgi:hypothetical protein